MIKKNSKYLNELKSSLEDKISARKNRKLIALKIALFSFVLSFVLFFSPILLQITSKELTYFCYFYSLSLFFAMFFSIKLGITPNNFYKNFYNK